MKNAHAKRAKILFFIVKYANLWGSCCRRRRGCLSSLLTLKESMQTRQCRMTCKRLLTYLGVEVIVLHTSFEAQMGRFYLSLHGFVF